MSKQKARWGFKNELSAITGIVFGRVLSGRGWEGLGPGLPPPKGGPEPPLLVRLLPSSPPCAPG